MDHFDFYQPMIAAIHEEHGIFKIPAAGRGSSLDELYSAVYLSCLLLFGKPGYLDVPAAQRFADPAAAHHLRLARYRELDEAEREEVAWLAEQYGHIKALVNPEINFREPL